MGNVASSRKIVYVAGPISRGDLTDNLVRAHAAGMALLKAGASPIVPHGNCFWGNRVVDPGHCDSAFVPEAIPDGTKLADWYDADLAIVPRCDALLRLDGESVGADKEAEAAYAAGLPVFFSVADVVLWLEG